MFIFFFLIIQGCYYCESETPGVPWCYVPPEHGYSMVGEPVETPSGYEVNLRRKNYPSWFGQDILEVKLEVEFQENHRLRLKVSGVPIYLWDLKYASIFKCKKNQIIIQDLV